MSSDNVTPLQTLAKGSIDMVALNGFLSSVGSTVGPELILSPGKDLFHYTDLNGLIGIVEKGDLWLTHSRYSNDEEEMAHGQRVAGEAITSAASLSANDPARTEYLQQLKVLIEKPSPEGVYICCFCQKGFGPWTGADCPHGLMRFWKVFYKAETQRKIVDGAINYSWIPGSTAAQCAQRAADAIQFFIPTFKNADFEEEAEWRLIFTPNPVCAVLPQFRVRGTMLVPYYRLRDLVPGAPIMGGSPLPIGHVTVGPSASKILNVASVRMLLDKSGQTSFRS
jgi:hypothetical protein